MKIKPLLIRVLAAFAFCGLVSAGHSEYEATPTKSYSDGDDVEGHQYGEESDKYINPTYEKEDEEPCFDEDDDCSKGHVLIDVHHVPDKKPVYYVKPEFHQPIHTYKPVHKPTEHKPKPVYVYEHHSEQPHKPVYYKPYEDGEHEYHPVVIHSKPKPTYKPHYQFHDSSPLYYIPGGHHHPPKPEKPEPTKPPSNNGTNTTGQHKPNLIPGLSSVWAALKPHLADLNKPKEQVIHHHHYYHLVQDNKPTNASSNETTITTTTEKYHHYYNYEHNDGHYYDEFPNNHGENFGTHIHIFKPKGSEYKESTSYVETSESPSRTSSLYPIEDVTNTPSLQQPTTSYYRYKYSAREDDASNTEHDLNEKENNSEDSPSSEVTKKTTSERTKTSKGHRVKSHKPMSLSHMLWPFSSKSSEKNTKESSRRNTEKQKEKQS